MKLLHTIAFILVIIGGINWGLFGIFPVDADGYGVDLVQMIFGFSELVQNIIYILIGISAVYLAVDHFITKGDTAK